MKDFFKNLLYIAINLGDAFCIAYVIYQLFSSAIFVVVVFSFLVVSVNFTDVLINVALRSYRKLTVVLSRGGVSKIPVSFLFVLVLFYSIFLFRNNALYVASFLLHCGFSWGLVSCAVACLVPCVVLNLFIIWVDLSLKIVGSWGKFNIFELFVSGALSWMIAKVFVSMLLRGSSGFVSMFLQPSLVVSSVPFVLQYALFCVVFVLFSDIVLHFFKVGFDFLKKCRTIIFENHLYSLFIFMLGLIRSWATGIGMRSLAFAQLWQVVLPANILGFFMEFSAVSVNLAEDVIEEKFDLELFEFWLVLQVLTTIALSFYVPLVVLFYFNIWLSLMEFILYDFKSSEELPKAEEPSRSFRHFVGVALVSKSSYYLPSVTPAV